ncbi:hypothetical protein PIB30_065298 [Stylosanthes scabra]|uniref:Uncharacterized protein n=1 Tax=Stylosanthes scabra TaxID=79078 RepID=A0ABU6SNU1_9FABA|nr:hypothetical protein [Stylosanthes scabra]
MGGTGENDPSLVLGIFNVSCSLSAKGKAKAYGPPTRASPRIAALRSQSAANPQPETPVTPAVTTPTPTLPPKKRPIQKAAGRTFIQTPKEQEVIAISSDSEPELAIKDTIHEIVEMEEDEEEDPEEDSEEAPQDAEVEAKVEAKEDPEEDPEEESAAEEVLREEDDFTDYWELVDSDLEDAAGDDSHF